MRFWPADGTELASQGPGEWALGIKAEDVARRDMCEVSVKTRSTPCTVRNARINGTWNRDFAALAQPDHGNCHEACGETAIESAEHVLMRRALAV